MRAKLRKEKPVMFRLLHVLFAICLLSNIGAVFLTNLMVAKSIPDIQIKETNPVQVSLNNFEQHPQAYSIFFSFVVQSLFYVIFSAGYFFMRYQTFTEKRLYINLGFMFGLTYILNYDFFNNLGFCIGGLL